MVYPRDQKVAQPVFRCVLHGSFRKHFGELQRIHKLFTHAGIEVLAPALSGIKTVRDGFAVLESDQTDDKRLIELLYLHHLKHLGDKGFSYVVNPDGYIGKTASYELGIAQLTNVRCFFLEEPRDHPVYVHRNAVWRPEDLAAYILEKDKLPDPHVATDEHAIHKLWEDLMVPGSVVAVGGIVAYAGRDAKAEPEVLLVKTHKWGNRFSIVGGKVRRGERLESALLREVREETGLGARVREHLCTFDQVSNSGYYQAGVQHIFVDNVVQVESRRVRLNEEAQEYVWMRPQEALHALDIEPNARQTLMMYAQRTF